MDHIRDRQQRRTMRDGHHGDSSAQTGDRFGKGALVLPVQRADASSKIRMLGSRSNARARNPLTLGPQHKAAALTDMDVDPTGRAWISPRGMGAGIVYSAAGSRHSASCPPSTRMSRYA